MSYRVQSLAPIILLLVLAGLLAAAIGAGGPAVWSQSPVEPGASSPLPTTVLRMPFVGTSPLPPAAPGAGAGATPSPAAPITPPGLLPGDSPLPAPAHSPLPLPAALGPSIWSSPLPWIGVGVAFFGVATWAALSLGRRTRADEDS